MGRGMRYRDLIRELPGGGIRRTIFGRAYTKPDESDESDETKFDVDEEEEGQTPDTPDAPDDDSSDDGDDDSPDDSEDDGEYSEDESGEDAKEESGEDDSEGYEEESESETDVEDESAEDEESFSDDDSPGSESPTPTPTPAPAPDPVDTEELAQALAKALGQTDSWHRDSNTIVHKQLTFTQFVDIAEMNGPFAKYRETLNNPKVGTSWFGDVSHDDAIAMARGDGYNPAYPNVEEILRHIEMDIDQSIQNGFDSQYGVSGAEIDMGRFLSGDPECMLESMPMKVMRTGRVLRLAVPAAVSSFVDPDIIRKRGIAVMALVDVCAKMQHPLEIYSVIATANYGVRGSYTVLVQEADQPLNPGRIMFALAHPSFLRLLGFAVMDAVAKVDPEIGRRLTYGTGYGSPTEITTDDLSDAIEENCIVLDNNRVRAKDWSESGSVEWVREQIKRIEEGSI